jgi:hypothetical protein
MRQTSSAWLQVYNSPHQHHCTYSPLHIDVRFIPMTRPKCSISPINVLNSSSSMAVGVLPHGPFSFSGNVLKQIAIDDQALVLFGIRSMAAISDTACIRELETSQAKKSPFWAWIYIMKLLPWMLESCSNLVST